MKKLLFVLMALCLVSSLAYAADATGTTATIETSATTGSQSTMATATPVATPAIMTLNGDVIDNMCAGANKANLTDFVKTHTKECALKPGCMETGYSIYANGKLYAFDKESSPKVAEFLKKADSKLQVTVTAKQVGDELSLVSIENQK